MQVETFLCLGSVQRSRLCVTSCHNSSETGRRSLQGKAVTWYRDNGELMQTGSFDAAEQKSGVWKRYHLSGQLMDEGKFSSGKKVGEWRVYDVRGRLTKTTTHKAAK